ncbi:MAG: hypothetical protein IJ088_07480 [Clostridia bacterium]|nr:hypothetical protein [Clostridia bacterium]
MNEITSRDAFAKAPPKRPAVLCVRGPEGRTDLIRTEWFTWLNMRRQPMIAYSLFRDASLGADLRSDDPLILAFPPVVDVKAYEKGFRSAGAGEDKPCPAGISLVQEPELKMLIPATSEIVLVCTLTHAYNYPFKKVRIFNCDLETAYLRTSSGRNI